jgi:hypothetical protein
MRPRLVIPAALALALAAHAASAGEAWKQGYSRQAQQALNRARTAAGGKGWEYLRGWHETGREGGLAYEVWYDPVRYGMRIERQEAAGKDVHGFNGLGAWRITAAGQVSGTDAAGVVAQARTEAFYGVSGFYFSGRFDAAGRYVGAKRLGGKSFEVVEVKPYGGEARELWFDRKTGLLARETGRGITTEFSDYRKVGPLKVAFRVATDDGTPGGRRERVVESVDFRPADRALFSLPRELH